MIYTFSMEQIDFAKEADLTYEQKVAVQREEALLRDYPEMKKFEEQGRKYINEENQGSIVKLLEDCRRAWGPVAPLVLLKVLMPEIVCKYEQKGIEEPIRRATLSDIGLWATEYEDQNKTIGLDRFSWLSHHMVAKILRLGRLQFEEGIFSFPYRIAMDNGLIRIFADEGIKCDKQGYITKGIPSFITRRNNEVDTEKGIIRQEEAERTALSFVLQQGDPVIRIHIPKGESFSKEKVDDSLVMARQRYPKAHFICDSWLLDPMLDEVLEEQSNCVQFMRRFKKFPLSQGTPQIYERVFGFGATREDILQWNCTTRLQQRVQTLVRQGRQFHTTGGILPIIQGQERC